VPPENPLAEDLDHILRHTRDLWADVRGRRIFVTGGTGFFGRWLLESFAHANRALGLAAQLVVLSRNPAAFTRNAPHLSSDAGIEFVTGDVRTLTARADLGRFDFMVHAATETTAKADEDTPLLMFDTIVSGTRAALDFAVATGARRFLLTSSGAVYGRQPSDMTHVPEDYAGAPDSTQTASAYGEGKRAAEFLCAAYQQRHGLETTIARCFAFVGPFLPLDAHFAIGNFIRDILDDRVIYVRGDGTPYRSYLHAADLAIWLWTILLRAPAGSCYNVGSEDRRSIREVAELVAQVGNGPGVQVANPADPRQPPAQYVPCCRRARDELSLREWIDLPNAVERTIRVLRRKDARSS
jgi:dTDP-glucose 4,6-dehydratase